MQTNSQRHPEPVDNRALLRIRDELRTCDQELGERIEALEKKRVAIRASLSRVEDCLRDIDANVCQCDPDYGSPPCPVHDGRAVKAMP